MRPPVAAHGSDCCKVLGQVRFGLEHPGHFKVLFEGRVVPRLDDPRIAGFGRPLLVRSIELIRDTQLTRPRLR